MNILGIADGFDAGVALVMDDQLVAVAQQERFDGVVHSSSFPWEAADAVLEEAGLSPADIDRVAVAGRFTPPFFVRRHPKTRKLLKNAFSPVWDWATFYQAMLRQTGLGALEADRAEAWFGEQLGARGYHPHRVVLVDTHQALAQAAYRSQREEDALVLTLHPLGDGVAAAVHRGRAGQLDKRWSQKGFASAHVHLRRCISAMGLTPNRDEPLLWALARDGRTDPTTLRMLHDRFRHEGDRLSRRRYPLPVRPHASIYRRLADMPQEDAAACIYENLRETVVSLVRHHLALVGGDTLAVGGELFENPMLMGDLAKIDGLSSISACPLAGHASLPLGAAIAAAGLAPQPLPASGLGVDAGACLDPEPALEALARGEMVARIVDRAGFGRHAGGNRSVLVRADDRGAVDRARTRLGLGRGSEPVTLMLASSPPEAVRKQALAMLEQPLRFGSAAIEVKPDKRYCATRCADGRLIVQLVEASHSLHPWMKELSSRYGITALACFPAALGQGPAWVRPDDSLRLVGVVDGTMVGSRWQ